MNTRIHCCLYIIFFWTAKCLAQNKPPAQVIDITKISILNPGISYEHGTAHSQSLYVRAYLTTLTGVAYSDAFGYTVQFDFNPGLSVQYRMYYNAAKRNSKGKRTDLNNLNYISPVSRIIISTRQVYTNSSVENYLSPVYTLAAVWGMQRNYKSHLSLDFNVGPGVVVSKDNVNGSGERISKNPFQFTIAGQFTVGFWFE